MNSSLLFACQENSDTSLFFKKIFLLINSGGPTKKANKFSANIPGLIADCFGPLEHKKILLGILSHSFCGFPAYTESAIILNSSISFK